MPRTPLIAIAMLLLPAGLAAQTGTVFGRIADSSGTPLNHATVSIDRTALHAMTSDRGDYELTGVPAGSQTVRARLIGYAAATARVTVQGGGRVRTDLSLEAQAVSLAAMDVVVGSRARHTAAEELAVPVDVFPAADIAQQGTRETSQILQSLVPAVNFPHQSVTDATDIVRPFTLRGLSPDHTLVLLNGWRYHQTAVVNTFAYGTSAGSSGADLNTIPASAIERIEVLRDGASAQYGSDAIAGVVNFVLREGPFAPFVNTDVGQYFAGRGYRNDGRTVNVNGGLGLGLGKGSLSLFGEVLDRQPTNRAWADAFDDSPSGVTDSVDAQGRVVVKRNTVPQPNMHWGDGLERDVNLMANLRLPLGNRPGREFYAFGGYSHREGNGEGYRRYASSDRNWRAIYPLGYLPEFHPYATDATIAAGYRGIAAGWAWDAGGAFGSSAFEYDLRNSLNASLGPCLVTACAPGADGVLGNADDPGIPNQTSFMAGRLRRQELSAGINAARSVRLGLPQPVNVAIGAAFRRETYRIMQGERASWIDGGDTSQAGGHASSGSQVFPGFSPRDQADAHRTNVGAYVDLESNLSHALLANVAGRFEHYSDFGSVLTGKAAVRLQATRRLVLRAAASTGFRAPGLGQITFSKVVTNVIAGVIEEIGVFPVGDTASRLLGAKPLKQETSVNLSGGLAFTPADNLTFTADYFRIAITNRILLGATFNDDSTRAILSRGGISGISGIQYFTNGLNTRTDGVDVTGNLRLPTGPGALEVTGAVNYTRNIITHIDPLPPVLQAPRSTVSGLIDSVTYIAITEERPDWRATLTSRYTTGRLSLLGRASYFGKFSSAQPGFCDRCRERYGAKTLVDAEVGYRLGQVSLALGARNLFNIFPDRPSSTLPTDASNPASDPAKLFNNNYGTFPWAAASPFGYNGRYLYSRLSIQLP